MTSMSSRVELCTCELSQSDNNPPEAVLRESLMAYEDGPEREGGLCSAVLRRLSAGTGTPTNDQFVFLFVLSQRVRLPQTRGNSLIECSGYIFYRAVDIWNR